MHILEEWHAVRCILSCGRVRELERERVVGKLNLKLWYGIAEKIYIIHHAHCTTRYIWSRSMKCTSSHTHTSNINIYCSKRMGFKKLSVNIPKTAN